PRATVAGARRAARHAAIWAATSCFASAWEIAATSACEGTVSTAPRRRRLILPSNAEGLARNRAIIIRCRSLSVRSPTRQAIPRRVALAPTLICVVLRAGLVLERSNCRAAVCGWAAVGDRAATIGVVAG